MAIDSFTYLPRSIAAYYQKLVVQKADPIPWTPLAKPLRDRRVTAVTIAGIYNKDTDPLAWNVESRVAAACNREPGSAAKLSREDDQVAA